MTAADSAKAAPSPHRLRRSYLLDPQWQLAAFRNSAGIALAAGILQMLALRFVAGADPIEQLSGEQIGWLVLATNGLFLLILLIGLFVVLVRMTHSVVGPARVLEAAVGNLRRGRFDSRLSLRKRDYLKPLAESLEGLSRHLQEVSGETRTACTELAAALDRQDAAAARELAARLQELHGHQPARADQHACV